jgi:hypothetical protein
VLARPGDVRLRLYDLLGRERASMQEHLTAGRSIMSFAGVAPAPGVYILSVSSGETMGVQTLYIP